MFIDSLKQTYSQNREKNTVLLRNLLKEVIQYYVLDFVYKSTWGENFILKGGTCLRFCFGLPRLSEDLDFDIENYPDFSLDKFVIDLKNYFQKDLQFTKIIIKPANNKRTIYLKFPILSDLNSNLERKESNTVIVRIDLTGSIGKKYKTEISIKSTWDLSFLIRRYSLGDLFSGKIAAILTREAMVGKEMKERFKGRDFFDLIWFLEKNNKPNWNYLEEITNLGKVEVIRKLDNKIDKVDLDSVKNDLTPFFTDPYFVDGFMKNFQNLYKSYKKILTS